MAKITFRGVQLRSWTGAIEEGGPIHRLSLLGDLSRPAAAALGIEDHFYDGESRIGVDAGREIKCKGSIRIDDFQLEPNGMKQQTINLQASDLEWEAYTKQGNDEEDEIEARIKIKIVTNTSFAVVENYARLAGAIDAVLKCTLAGGKQMKLVADDAAEGEAAEGESGEKEGGGAPLASKSRMKRAPKVDGGAMAESARAASAAAKKE